MKGVSIRSLWRLLVQTTVALLVPAAFLSCNQPAVATCSSTGDLYAHAKSVYVARNYAGASTLFEKLSRDLAHCNAGSDSSQEREAANYDLMTAGEAAHWDHDSVRARRLVARALANMHQLDSAARTDRDLDPILTGDEKQAASDLAGTWTFGVRQ